MQRTATNARRAPAGRRQDPEPEEPEIETPPDDDEGGLSLTGFLSHKTSGGSGEFLRNWKDDGEIDVWVHPKSRFHALWNHSWYRVIEAKDKQTKELVQMVINVRWNCLDRETVLKKQRFRDDEGRREYPPELCPACFLTDWIWTEIAAGRLDWTTEVFRFEGDDPDHAVTIHAGGIVSLFNRKDVTKEQIGELRRAHISRADAWKENMQAKCQYLFQVVDDSDLSAGIVKAIQAGALGDAFKRAIRNEIKVKGDKGNPAAFPYPFKWTFDDGKDFDDKYDCIALTDRRPGPDVLALLRGPKLDVTEETAPGNCPQLRAELERHALIGLPYDELFAAAEEKGLMRPDESPAKKTSAAVPAKAAPAARPAPNTGVRPQPAAAPKPAAARGKAPPEPEEPEAEDEEEDDEADDAQDPAPAAEEDTFGCDFCDEDIAQTDLVCPHCASTYDEKSGKIDGIPCTACRTIVPLEGAGPNHICPKCASIHMLTRTPDESRACGQLLAWAPLPKDAPAAAKPARRSRADAPAAAAVKPAAKAPAQAAPAKPPARRAAAKGKADPAEGD